MSLEPFTTPFDAQTGKCATYIKSLPGSFNSTWPTSCSDITGTAINTAIAPKQGAPSVGFMLLNGRRLGNLGAIEAIPTGGVTRPFPAMSIQGFQQTQIKTLGLAALAGEIVWTNGTRGGIDGDIKLRCPAANGNLTNCYAGRFGWIGDRVSLEDQVANAAFVEMNISTNQGYKDLYGSGIATFPLRYNFANCGPANLKCRGNPPTVPAVQSNSDLLEQDVERMADYARWLGSPTRSDFTVTLPDVVAGEKVFVNLQCNLCHVISKIPITDPNDTMLPKYFRDRLTTHAGTSFLSYLGTDLLMHDMGYLSQIGYPNIWRLETQVREW